MRGIVPAKGRLLLPLAPLAAMRFSLRRWKHVSSLKHYLAGRLRTCLGSISSKEGLRERLFSKAV